MLGIERLTMRAPNLSTGLGHAGGILWCFYELFTPTPNPIIKTNLSLDRL